MKSSIYQVFLKNPNSSSTIMELTLVDGSIEYNYNASVKTSGQMTLLMDSDSSYLKNLTKYDIQLERLDVDGANTLIGSFIPIITEIKEVQYPLNSSLVKISFYEYSYILSVNEMPNNRTINTNTISTELNRILGYYQVSSRSLSLTCPDQVIIDRVRTVSWEVGENALTVFNRILSANALESLRSLGSSKLYTSRYIAPQNKNPVITAGGINEWLIDGTYMIGLDGLNPTQIRGFTKDLNQGSNNNQVPKILTSASSSASSAANLGFRIIKCYTGIEEENQTGLDSYVSARMREYENSASQQGVSFSILYHNDVSIGSVIETAIGNVLVTSLSTSLTPGDPPVMSIKAHTI